MRASDGGRSTLRVAGLFAGIGGLELGLERAGHKTVLLCENDEGATAVLRARFPDVKCCPDVRRLDPKELPKRLDLISAGFPCQDLSQAGDTAGIDGIKSSLVGEVFRLLEARRVPWVLLENVPFMLHLDRGRAMDLLATRLEKLGYRWAYRVVEARAFGLPQRRRRVFLVATITGNPAEVLLSDEAKPRETCKWDPGRPVGFYWTEGNRGVGWAVEAVPTLKGGSGLGIPSPPAVLMPNGSVVTPSLRAAERLQGFPAGWTRPAEAAAHLRFRWRLIGNAVNVRVAQWIGERLSLPRAFDERLLGAHIRGSRWPSAACNLGEGRRVVAVSEWPRRAKRSYLDSFLGDAIPLSARATEGFVFRAERAAAEGKLLFPPKFLKRLRAHLWSLQKRAI